MTKANKTDRKSRTRRKSTNQRGPNVYAKGWDRKRVEALAKYYENQTDEEAIAEIDAHFRAIEASKKRNAGKSLIPHQQVMREFGLASGRKKRNG